MIKRQIEETDSDFDREKLQERLAKLSGGVAVIQVGAATETELKEKKHRIEDALSATRAAVQEGMIPGGGSSLIHALKALEAYKPSTDQRQRAHGRRREDRHRHHPPRARRAAASDRDECRLRRFRRSQPGEAGRSGPHGLRCDVGRHRRHARSRNRRAVQSNALGPTKRGVDRFADPHHRNPHRRQTGTEVATARPAAACRAAAWAAWAAAATT